MLRMPTDVYLVSHTIEDPDNRVESECSGRSLATLLVAWVGAAMIASVLLRWKYMWIALAILTLLFLLACGYAVCRTRSNYQREIIRQNSRIIEQRPNVRSVSGAIDNHSETGEPPAYQAYWITDLPPPYAVVITSEPPPILSPEEEQSGFRGRRLSNPPPYSLAIQPEHTIVQSGNLSATEIDYPDDLSGNARNKNLTEQTRIEQTVTSSRTQYLSNFISSTFGRGPRRQPDRTMRNHINRNEIGQNCPGGLGNSSTSME